MKMKYKVLRNDLPRMKKSSSAVRKKTVQVGASWENAWLADIHEYGCKITVTPKMRAYLHSMGLHLKDTTTTITIPERSFLRASWDEHSGQVIAKAEKALLDVADGTMSADEYLKMVGLLLTSMVKDYATNLNRPANHPFTVEQKGSANPLVDTGNMIESISYEVI